VYEPLGSVTPQQADVRVLAATHQDLARLVRRGRFREDLFYRVNVVRLQLPPLRDRREDIPLLIDSFIERFNRLGGNRVVGVDDQAMAILMAHDYPGNVRELENIIEHAFILRRVGLIGPEHLPAPLQPENAAIPPTRGRSLQAMERLQIVDALRRAGGNRRAAARELGIHPSTLYRKAQAMDIDLPSEDGRHVS
jgi:transcriptional regulator with PAS, ATPase and Fis domain